MKKYTFRVNGYLETISETSYFLAKEKIRLAHKNEIMSMELVSITKQTGKTVYFYFTRLTCARLVDGQKEQFNYPSNSLPV